jgi:hypothetical protein
MGTVPAERVRSSLRTTGSRPKRTLAAIESFAAIVTGQIPRVERIQGYCWVGAAADWAGAVADLVIASRSPSDFFRLGSFHCGLRLRTLQRPSFLGGGDNSLHSFGTDLSLRLRWLRRSRWRRFRFAPGFLPIEAVALPAFAFGRQRCVSSVSE